MCRAQSVFLGDHPKKRGAAFPKFCGPFQHPYVLTCIAIKFDTATHVRREACFQSVRYDSYSRGS